MSLSVLIDLKDKSHNFIQVIINYLIKMFYYKLVKVMIDISDLAKIIINMIVDYHSIPKSIIIDQDLLFILKF